ncbi:hypothetical protein N665_9218s0001 [Sinapis alba]|nr:hypothetical protein N665_9218s0001 [Sinapis alba]
MATEGEATFSAATSDAARGTGGKLRRPTARKHTTTPYSRPPQNEVQRRPWISRIVDPAYRIISGGATRILPYFFSNAASAPEDEEDQHQGLWSNASRFVSSLIEFNLYLLIVTM